jgi:glycosyltransferase involved in cell wall biosynthesis
MLPGHEQPPWNGESEDRPTGSVARNRPMRVVQLVPELNEGGVERGVVELNRELGKRGVESIVVSAGGRFAMQVEAEGGRHFLLDVCGKNPLTALPRTIGLRRLLRQLQPDILHARSRVPAWLTFLANRSLGIPFVTTVHGFNSVNPYSRVMTFGDRVICVSTAIKEYIQRHYRVPDEKIAVIPRGIDLERFDPEGVDRTFMADFSKQYGLGGRFVITSAGRITELKDYETFIRAIGTLRADIPEVLGLVVGGVRKDKERYFESLQRLVESLGLAGHVRFTGSQSCMAEIYAMSRVVVSSSRKPESFGRTAAEALAMNVPVVATWHGGILDIVLDGETGYLFPPGDAAALASGILSCRLHRLAGLRDFVVSRFTLTRMTESTLGIYSELYRTDRFRRGPVA